MRRLVSIVAVLSFVLSCAKTSPVPVAGRIEFGSGFAEMRSAFDDSFNPVWGDDDVVGIYAILDGRSLGKNMPYAVEPSREDASRARFVPAGGALNWSGAGRYDFFAYSPYRMEEFSPSAVPFTLPAVQDSDGGASGLAAYDFVAARASVLREDASGGNARVDFLFRHLFCIVRFDLAGDPSLAGKHILKAVLSSPDLPLAGVSGTMDLSAEPAEIKSSGTGSGSVSLRFAQAPAIPASGCSLCFVCLPSGGKKTDLGLSIILDDGQVLSYTFPAVETASNSLLTLRSGQGPVAAHAAGVQLPACLSLACNGNSLLYAGIAGGCLMADNGISLERDDAPIHLTASADNPYVFSAGWSLQSSWTISVPLAEAFSGRLRMDFKMMPRGIANWQAEWSSDGHSWFGASRFALANSTKTAACVAYFDIPDTAPIPAGGVLFIRLKPFDSTPCSAGGLTFFDETSDPRIMHSIVLTPCVPQNTPAPEAALLFCPFDDCIEGVDAVGLGAERLLDAVSIDGPGYPGAQNCCERHGYLRVGLRSSKAEYLSPTIDGLGTSGADVELGIDLAAYFSSAGAYDTGVISLGILNGTQEQTRSVSTGTLSDGKWHHMDFGFSNVTAGSQVFVHSSSARFYIDNIRVTAK